MSVVIMKVIKAEKHPNADSLRLYEMQDNDGTIYPIIANLENVYEVNDFAIIAKEGTTLKDGTKIKPSKIRGIASYGMALGKSDLPIGTDISDQYAKQNVSDDTESAEFIKWPSIESLFNVRKGLVANDNTKLINYIGKIKLHGTNAAVQVFPSGKILTQSRTQFITPANDNAGFAAWVDKNIDYFINLKGSEHKVIYGEFVGPGVNSGCAIHKIPNKIFAVFAIQYGSYLDVNPKTIKETLPDHPDIYVLPFEQDYSIKLDYRSVEKLQEQADIINKWIDDIEKCDPFVKREFQVEGVGEGLVMYPMPANDNGIDFNDKILISRLDFTELVFKAKGNEHKVVKTKKAVQIDPEVPQSIKEFVELFATEARLNQIAQTVGQFDMKLTGKFIKEFSEDVKKESVAELDAAGMRWEHVGKAISQAASKWWIEKCKSI